MRVLPARSMLPVLRFVASGQDGEAAMRCARAPGLGWVGGLISRSQPGLCTPMDIRWKRARKFSLFLTFRSARRDPDVSGLDQQAVPYQADRTWLAVFLGEQNTMWDVEPEILISIFADCSLSRTARDGESSPIPRRIRPVARHEMRIVARIRVLTVGAPAGSGYLTSARLNRSRSIVKAAGRPRASDD
jgi:hypothetical protein